MDKRKGKRVRIERFSSASDSLDCLFERFILSKTAEGRAKGTLKQYKNNYGFFTDYLDSKGLRKDFRIITKELIRDYIVYMLNEKIRFDGHKYKSDAEKTVGLSPSTINTRLKTLRTLFQFIESEGYIQENPMNTIKNVDEHESSIQVLTIDQLKRLLDAPNQRNYADYRDYVLMNLLLDTFIRINEALTLRVEDIDLESRLVTIRSEVSKNRKARTLPIQKRTAGLIQGLIKENVDFDSDYLFLANYGEPLTANHFRKRLKQYAQKAEILGNVHPHLLRHTGATLFLENGGDLRHLQIILGHSDLRMVLRYTHLSKDSIKRQHEQYSPLNDVVGKLNKERKVKR